MNRRAKQPGQTTWTDYGATSISQAAELHAQKLRMQGETKPDEVVVEVECQDSGTKYTLRCERVVRWKVHGLRGET